MKCVEYNFKYKPYSPSSPEAQALAAVCKLNAVVAAILLNRGIDTEEKVSSFLNKDASLLHDPFLLKDMDRAVSRIKRALLCKEKITVYGDYDVDGITATSIVFLYLREKGAPCDYYIPDREDEGYGLSEEALHKIAESGTNLIITVDTGITAAEEVETSKSLGMDIIVTDHHLCTGKLPDTITVNPQRPDCTYPFKSLAGVGVAFKLLTALESGNHNLILNKFSDLVALGTVADMMELTGENRAIVSSGLDKINSNPNAGLALLMESAGISDRKKDSSSIGFSIAPRINAAGRMASPYIAAELLISDNHARQSELCAELETLNNQRRNTESSIEKAACARIDNKPMYKDKKIYVLADPEWQAGVLGIAASKVADRYNRPCILMTCEDGTAKGSARSAGDFNLYQAMKSCEDLYDKFGGHEFAAGLTIAEEKIPELFKRLNDYADKHMDLKSMLPVMNIEFDFPPELFTPETINSLEILEPFGNSNPHPIFAFKNAYLASLTPMGEGNKHMRLQLNCGGTSVTAVAFNKSELSHYFEPGDTVDVAGTLSVNEWNGRIYPQLMLSAVKPSEKPPADQKFTQDELRLVFKYIKSNLNTSKSASLHARIIEKQTGIPFDREKFVNALEIFVQLRLITYTSEDDVIGIYMLEMGRKVNLTDSPLFRKLQA
ncbi:MAG: single-stranded-DNA-specific exonuclease RecJ [Clostridia bacterium]|nr:single-stranded-DNA-specific exonuclease RecJ [Clostridia bacterium]